MSEQIFALPDLGEGLTEAELVVWLVAVGDTVDIDQPIAEVETAKATVEVPSPYAGIVTVLHAEPGVTVDVGSPLISIQAADSADSAGDVPPATPTHSGSGNVLIGYGTSSAGPTTSRRRRAARPAGPAAPVAPVATQSPAVSSPAVRQLARELGVDLTTLVGTGTGGLITRADVEAAGSARSAAATQVPDPRPILERVPLRGVRGAMAEKLSRSRREIPEVTIWLDVDATDLIELRKQARAAGDEAPGLMAIIARFAVAGLADYPELNSRVDTIAGEIRHYDGVNLGIAVQADRGLLVPVLRDAHQLSAHKMHDALAALTATTRDGRATAADLTGGTFTLNNYGTLGVDGSTPIINHPEVAMLGVGRIIERPWVVDGTIAVRHVTQLSLVFDHRVCDGGTAAGYLRFVADAIQQPAPTLARLDVA